MRILTRLALLTVALFLTSALPAGASGNSTVVTHLEHDNHEHLGPICLAAHDQGLQETGVLLFDGTQLLEDLQNLCFPLRIRANPLYLRLHT